MKQRRIIIFKQNELFEREKTRVAVELSSPLIIPLVSPVNECSSANSDPASLFPAPPTVCILPIDLVSTTSTRTIPATVSPSCASRSSDYFWTVPRKSTAICIEKVLTIFWDVTWCSLVEQILRFGMLSIVLILSKNRHVYFSEHKFWRLDFVSVFR
jgi:hypothetical protein